MNIHKRDLSTNQEMNDQERIESSKMTIGQRSDISSRVGKDITNILSHLSQNNQQTRKYTNNNNDDGKGVQCRQMSRNHCRTTSSILFANKEKLEGQQKFHEVTKSGNIAPFTQAYHQINKTNEQFSCEKENNYFNNCNVQPVRTVSNHCAPVIRREDENQINIQDSVSQHCSPMQACESGVIQEDNPQAHLQYTKEIIDHLLLTEEKFRAKGGYIGVVQTEINERMRGILLDWLVDVHFKFKLCTETLFLAINLIDRYLEKVNLGSTQLQLLGITSLFIASKYEEVYAVPHIKDLVYVCDNAYVKEEIFQMEGNILQSLSFNILHVSSYRMLDYFVQFDEIVGQKNYFLCRYLLEIALLEYSLLGTPASLIAAASIYLVNKIRKRSLAWNQDMVRLTGYTEQSIRPCAKQLCHIVQTIELRKYLASLRKKFQKPVFLEVAKIKIEHRKETFLTANNSSAPITPNPFIQASNNYLFHQDNINCSSNNTSSSPLEYFQQENTQIITEIPLPSFNNSNYAYNYNQNYNQNYNHILTTNFNQQQNATLSQQQNATLSQQQNATLSQQQNVTLSQQQNTTLSQQQNATLSQQQNGSLSHSNQKQISVLSHQNQQQNSIFSHSNQLQSNIYSHSNQLLPSQSLDNSKYNVSPLIISHQQPNQLFTHQNTNLIQNKHPSLNYIHSNIHHHQHQYQHNNQNHFNQYSQQQNLQQQQSGFYPHSSNECHNKENNQTPLQTEWKEKESPCDLQLQQVESLELSVPLNSLIFLVERRMTQVKDKPSHLVQTLLSNRLYQEGAKPFEVKVPTHLIVNMIEKKISNVSNKQLLQLPITLANIVVSSMLNPERLEDLTFIPSEFLNFILESLLHQESTTLNNFRNFSHKYTPSNNTNHNQTNFNFVS